MMRLIIGIQITFLVTCCQCWIPFVYEPVDLNDPHYIALFKHALEMVGSSTPRFRIMEYLVKDEIIESSHKVTYYDNYGQLCHITFTVNSVVGTQVPAIPICSYVTATNQQPTAMRITPHYGAKSPHLHVKYGFLN